LSAPFVTIDKNNKEIKLVLKRGCDARNESCGQESNSKRNHRVFVVIITRKRPSKKT